MIDQIIPDLYRIEIPLPRNPLKSLNSYLIRGENRFLLIDTGMNREECRQEMFSSLKKIGVELKKTDFFITHLHVDHLGLVATLATETSEIYFNSTEAAMMNIGSLEMQRRWQQIHAIYLASGLPENELKTAASSHPWHLYGFKRHLGFATLSEGKAIEIGDYSLRCIETPGHSPGHMCLYEADKKLLISGDHILFDITPNINFWLGVKNPLRKYLSSLEKVYDLDVSLVLPGHRNISNRHRERINELRQHHKARLNEIVSVLEDGEKTAFEIAAHVSWDVDYGSWKSFPASQKWFAIGETIAHLEYLEEEGVVVRKTRGDKVAFSLR